MRSAVAAECVAAAVPAAGFAAGCSPVDHALALGAAGTHASLRRRRRSDLPCGMLGNF